ncbi:MAG: hypothetical protein ACLVJH_05980 [Faecalibacterium prausnitzii]
MSGLQSDRHRRAMPGRTVTNEELSRTVDTSDEWITTRTGIRTRHYCTEGENAATLAIAAAKQALQRSGLAPRRHCLLRLCHPFRPGRHPKRGLSGAGGAEPAGKPPCAGRQRRLFRLSLRHGRGARTADDSGRAVCPRHRVRKRFPA